MEILAKSLIIHNKENKETKNLMLNLSLKIFLTKEPQLKLGWELQHLQPLLLQINITYVYILHVKP